MCSCMQSAVIVITKPKQHEPESKAQCSGLAKTPVFVLLLKNRLGPNSYYCRQCILCMIAAVMSRRAICPPLVY